MCEVFQNDDHVMPGRGCCVCNVYNGAWRDECKECGAPACDDVPLAALRTEWDEVVGGSDSPFLTVAALQLANVKVNAASDVVENSE